MRLVLALVMLAVCLAPASAATTQPAPTADELELAATNALNAGDYDAALSLFKKVAEMIKDDADHLARIEEQMRVCEKNVVRIDLDAARKAIKPVPRPDRPPADVPDVPTAPEERTPHPAPKEGEVIELDIKQLGNFEYDPQTGGGVPDDVLRLSGTKLRTRGFMIPLTAAERVSEFVLVVDLAGCCFGQPPGVQHMILVKTPEGKTVRYFGDEIIVEGVLTVEEKREEDYTIGLFEMVAASIKPAAR
jgi:hypothetical protein